jgi:hypothetical protein
MVAGGSLHRSVQNEAAIFGSQIYVIFAIFCSKIFRPRAKGDPHRGGRREASIGAEVGCQKIGP